MKKIEAILKDESLDSVKEALLKAGFVGMTASTIKGRGREGGILLEWRAGPYRVDFLHKVLLMLVVRDEDADDVVRVIAEECRAHHGGDGMIFVSTVDAVLRVDGGEQDDEALQRLT